MAIIQPSRPRKKKKPLTKAQQALRDQELKMLAKHQAPLELGAKAKGLRVKVEITRPPEQPQPAKSQEDEAQRWRNKMCGSTAPRTSTQYTGSEVKSISTMHKSNPIPCFSEEAILDVARMRR